MKKITFDFLAEMPLKEIDKSPVNVIGGKVPSPGADFRLFSDGSIYPSQERIDKDNLEFQKKESGLPEYGYDVFVSTDWSQFTSDVSFVCIAKASKHLGKVDLFGSAKYNKDGTPKSSVANQKTTAGNDLITYLEKVYCEAGEKLFDNRTFVDLKINYNSPVKETETKIYHLPKIIQKGKNAGQPTYERRESIQIFPLEIVETAASSSGSFKPEHKTDFKTEEKVEKTEVKSSAVPQEIASKLFS